MQMVGGVSGWVSEINGHQLWLRGILKFMEERNILCMTRSTGWTTEVERSLHCESVLEDVYFI